MTTPTLDEAATEAFADWVREQGEEHGRRDLAFTRTVAERLGAIPEPGSVDDTSATGRVAFAFWLPQLERLQVASAELLLELLAPPEDLDLTVSSTTATFHRSHVALTRVGEVGLAVVDGVRVGRRDVVGHLYAVRYRDRSGRWHRALDPMSASLPYGAFAPAEVYDVSGMLAARGDTAHWSALAEQVDGEDRLGPGILLQGPSTNILQVHVPTATPGGTLASLARSIRQLARTVEDGAEPTPAEQVALGYDAIQLLPLEPTITYEDGPVAWTFPDDDGDDPDATEPTDGPVDVDLRRPDTTNWGYDVVIAGSAAISPTLLETGRPDELLDVAEALHTFPGGAIRLIADVVYGHADNQGMRVLDEAWFAGPNMYGQNLAYRNEWVRAQLLEMQRRRVAYGFDGVRVDGAQDVKWYDAAEKVLRHDDAYLQLMSDVVQEQPTGEVDADGEPVLLRHRPWMVFEDGRPWPQPDWELSSTYRAVSEMQPDPDVFQWGPLTFAHNTPFVYGFWLRSWWRIRQIVEHGEDWISGCANHDTLRRGTQVSPDKSINERLGETKLQVLDRAYDNPAITLLTHAAFPGVPMDFLNASMRAAWGFIRNQDDRWGVKVVSEEAISLVWQVDDEFYDLGPNFRRLKDMGFETLADLRRFTDLLPSLVEVTDYDLDAMARLLGVVEPPLVGPFPIDADGLKAFARAWMDDMHEYANVARWAGRLEPSQTTFNLAVRRFRQARRWLRRNLTEADHFSYVRPVDGHAVFVCLRTAPTDGEQVLLVANMEGGPFETDPVRLDVPGLDPDGWQIALRTPNIGDDWTGGPVVLEDSTGVVLTRRR